MTGRNNREVTTFVKRKKGDASDPPTTEKQQFSNHKNSNHPGQVLMLQWVYTIFGRRVLG